MALEIEGMPKSWKRRDLPVMLCNSVASGERDSLRYGKQLYFSFSQPWLK